MSDLHLWMQAWSDQGEQMLARVESVDRFDNYVIALDCSDEDFRSVEASLYQVLRRTTSKKPLRLVQQTKKNRNGTQYCEGTIRGTCQTKIQRMQR